MRARMNGPDAARLLCLLVLVILPFFVPSAYIRHLIIVAVVYAIVASNWNFSLGYGGIFNFGHLAFFGLGAYGSAILAKTVGITPWLTIIIAGVIAVVAAVIVSVPVLRLKGIYVVLVTFAFSQLCLQLIMSQQSITGGSQGFPLVPQLTIGSYSFASDDKFGYYYVALFLLVFSTIYLQRLVRSSFGVSVVALKDNEDYAISRGISLARQRLLTLVASAFFTGMAGGFFSTYTRVASPEIFGFGPISLALSMMLLGGTGSIYGPIVGAFLITIVSEAMVNLGPVRFLIISGMIVIVLIFYPGGTIVALSRLYDRAVRLVAPRFSREAS